MAIGSVLTFTEPDQMEAAHIASRAEVVPIGSEHLAWHITRVELDFGWFTCKKVGPVYDTSNWLRSGPSSPSWCNEGPTPSCEG